MGEILTGGVIEMIRNEAVKSHEDMIPVLQVTELKMFTAQTVPSKERIRVLLSDGTAFIQGMLGITLNPLVKDGLLQAGSILRLDHFLCSEIQKKKIVVISQLEVIATNADIIGARKPNNNDPRGGVGDSNPTSGFRSNTEIGATVLPQQRQQVYGSGSSFQLNGSRSDVSSGGRQNNNTGTGTATSHVGQQQQRQQVYGSGSNSTLPGSYNNPSSGLVRDPPTRHQPPPPMYQNRGPVARNEAPPLNTPINSLNPYSGRWTIKARVTSKGDLRRFNNQRGDGKVFSFDLLDAHGGEIRVTCFNDVADQFYDQIVFGNLYLVSRGKLRPAEKKYNHLPHDYEITLDNASTVQQCYEEDAAIPQNLYNFRSIGDIESMETNSIIDVIGVVSSISPTGTIMRKTGTETQKRSLQLKDMSGRSVEVTMWGSFCNAEGQKLQSLCDSGEFPVLAVKSGRVSEFNGKAVSTIGSSQLLVEPDFVEARKLKEWFEREGRSAPCVSISREFNGSGRVDVRKTISQIKDEKLGTSEKPDWITVNATIIYMKVDNFYYTACPIMNGDRPCNKKVTDNGDGTWRCEKCDKSVDECDYRYILQLQLQDHTGLTWVTAFQEAGEEIMGMPAKDLYYVKHEHNDEQKFEDIIRKVAFTKYMFKLKVKEETYGDEPTVKATVVKVDKVNYSSDTRVILGAIEKLRTETASSLPVRPEGSHYTADAGTSGIGTSSLGRREFGLPANQSVQYGGGAMSCYVCGNSGHVSANCPNI
ncbi:Replication protein A 70 kDa DNA-binding subunit E [Raphanus sativus]|uniref:Replication protein A subunit n=1 Tax=Raphanus sativus TaxID=3726 RepID=A0A9W3CWE8_RAPSA|nr:replication protein A 70 kDa DNA-binding subunit E-like [Raphanus sativus]KAJ4868444.1 Replication protein A 70 kDa DNA-binding subunit E [Raphanus sativus]